jgi:hypothetical protein
LKTNSKIIFLAIIVFCALGHLAAAPAGDDSAMRTSRWQEDLDFFARELPVRQKDFYLLMPKDKFERDVAELKREIPQLSDSDIILQLSRMVAGLGVAHTEVDVSSGTGALAMHRYPVRMEWFSDGLAVVAAAPEYQGVLGGRVVRIGSMTPDRVETILTPYIPHENKAKLQRASPSYMNLAELMQREKIANAAGHLQLTCAQAGGQEFKLEIAPTGPAETSRNLLTAAKTFHIPTEFCHKRPKAFYWYEYLPDTQTLYIQYSKCHDEPGNPFADFTRQLFAFADSHPVQRVIVDLRFNGGGSSEIVKPLVDGLKSRPALSAKGHLYALIGSGTFSSAMFAVRDFRDGLEAILVGEPTGNKPNHYGQAESFVLPNSKLKVQYSIKHFHLAEDGDPPAFYPDIAVPVSIQDFLTARDPVLAAALHHPSQ